MKLALLSPFEIYKHHYFSNQGNNPISIASTEIQESLRDTSESRAKERKALTDQTIASKANTRQDSLFITRLSTTQRAHNSRLDVITRTSVDETANKCSGNSCCQQKTDTTKHQISLVLILITTVVLWQGSLTRLRFPT
jgi:hypothetical protein